MEQRQKKLPNNSTPVQVRATPFSKETSSKLNKLPSNWQMFKTFLKAVFKHVSTGGKKISRAQYAERLSTCYTCEHRKGERCGACGCYIQTKSAWETSKCPKEKWQ